LVLDWYLIVDAADGQVLGVWGHKYFAERPLNAIRPLSKENQETPPRELPAVKLALSSDGGYVALARGRVMHGNFSINHEPSKADYGSVFNGTVTDVVFLSDNRSLAVAGGDNQIFAYDCSKRDPSFGRGHNGEQWFRAPTLEGHADRINSLACDPNGAFLVSGSGDTTVKIWQLPSGEERHTLDEHRGAVTCVAVGPHGKQLASSSEDGTVKIWGPSNRKSRMTILAHENGATSVAFSPDGSRIVSGGRDRLAKIWDATTGEQLETLRGHADRINSVTFSPGGDRVATASRDGTMKVWASASNADVLVLRSDESIAALAFSPDSKLLAAGLRDTTVSVWDVTTGQQAHRLGVPDEEMTSTAMGLTFSPDGRRIGTSSSSSGPTASMKVWALDGDSLLVDAAPGGGSFGSSLAFSPDGMWIASALDFVAWPAEAREAIGELPESLQPWLGVCDTDPGSPHQGRPANRTWLPRNIAVFGPLSDAETIREAQLANEDHQGLYSISHVTSLGEWRPKTPDSDGGRVPTRRSRYDDVEQNEAAATAPTAPIAAIALEPGGTRLATGDVTGLIQLWDMTTGKLTAAAAGHTAPVNSLAFSPDGKRIVSGSADGTVKLWDTTTGLLLLTLTGHADAVTCVAFSPDGRRIASGGNDKTVRLWDSLRPTRSQAPTSDGG